MRLEARNINYVKSIPLEVRANVLYQFLKMGVSMREIGKHIPEMGEISGWQVWAIIHFYGFEKNHKKFYVNSTLKKLTKGLLSLKEKDIEEFHSSEETIEDVVLAYYLNSVEGEGTDLFLNIKTRIGEYKFKKQLLENYQHKCALCNISHSKLLMTCRIKPWLEATKDERLNLKNAIILCNLHDTLFKNGFISLSDQYEVIYSSDFDFSQQGIVANLIFDDPKADAPALALLREHREMFNLTISQGRIF